MRDELRHKYSLLFVLKSSKQDPLVFDFRRNQRIGHFLELSPQVCESSLQVKIFVRLCLSCLLSLVSYLLSLSHKFPVYSIKSGVRSGGGRGWREMAGNGREMLGNGREMLGNGRGWPGNVGE